MGFIDTIKARAKADKKTIVLPESEDRRTYEAAAQILKEDLANLIIIGSEEAVKKGMTPEKARETILNDYTYYGVMMVKMGDADGLVSGACHSTANTLRPCLQILKTKPGTKLVSAFFLMVVPDCEYGDDGVFVFGDCGLNQNPNPEELAAIAESSAESYRMLTGNEPRVAMLSHSSKGSAKHADVDKVVEATRIANIGYKLVQRLAKAEAYGPMTQGIAAPVNDLSRGCSAEDIVGVVAITAVQCQAQ